MESPQLVPRLEEELRIAWAEFLAAVDVLHQPELKPSSPTVGPSRASVL